MRTSPDIPIDDHIRNVVSFIRSHDPAVDNLRLRCFDEGVSGRNCRPGGMPESAIGDLDDLRTLIARLCLEGREWIDLGGAGATRDGGYVISVAYSERTGMPITAIVLSGPRLDSMGNVQRNARVICEVPEEE